MELRFLLECAEADEGFDALVDGVGAAVGDGRGSIEIVGLGEEGDFGFGAPVGEVVGELRDEGDGVLGVEVSHVGDDQIVVGIRFDGEGFGGHDNSLCGVSGDVVRAAEGVLDES